MVSKVPKIKASTPNRVRNAFDLSQRHLFTAHAGMLLPVLSLDLLPHDHIEINASDFMRTMPINSSAFLSLRSVYEFFFVPYHQLYPQFDQFITGMSDYHSKVVNDIYGGVPPTMLPSVNLGAADGLFAKIDAATGTDIFGYPVKAFKQRLCDLFGFGRSCRSDGTLYTNIGSKVNSITSGANTVNLFRPAAYQKIYQDYYRNTTYETFDVKTFSLDPYSGLVSATTVSDNFFIPRYRNAQQDYLSNVRPSALFSMPTGLSTNPMLNLGTRNGQAPLVDSLFATGNSVGLDIKGNHDSFSNTSLYDTQSVNVSSLRSAFAVDKLLRVTMQAGKTFQDQMRAHYGVEIPESRDGKVNYLGGFDSNVQLSDVVQTSGTTSSTDPLTAGYLGKINVKGTASGHGKIVFDAPEHGVLMCIYSLVPMAAYDSTRLDPMVIKTGRFDFFTPEFENLGLQPLVAKTVTGFADSYAAGNQVIGWQPRYSEYKTALDINHGQFGFSDTLSYYTTSRIRQATYFPGSIGIAHFKVNPSWLDSVFAVSYNGYETNDCMYGGVNFNIVKVSDMSESGQPKI